MPSSLEKGNGDLNIYAYGVLPRSKSFRSKSLLFHLIILYLRLEEGPPKVIICRQAKQLT